MINSGIGWNVWGTPANYAAVVNTHHIAATGTFSSTATDT
jgi:hypothetical protein